MSQNNFDPIISQDNLPSDDSAPSNVGNPISQAEVDELLYGEGLTTSERLARLRMLREDIQMQEADDVGQDDPQGLLMSIDEAIATLASADSADDIGMLEIDRDPADHLETLSPDDDLRLVEEDAEEELVDEDEEAAVISDWDAENDGHDGRHGFH